MRRPDHKAVEIRIRHSEEKRGRPEWKYAAWYPKEMKEKVTEIIKKEIEEKNGGTEKKKIQTWQREVRTTLQGYEKETKKEEGRRRQGLKEKRDKWLEQAKIMLATRRKAEGIAERFQRQIDGKEIERAKGMADIYRERE